MIFILLLSERLRHCSHQERITKMKVRLVKAKSLLNLKSLTQCRREGAPLGSMSYRFTQANFSSPVPKIFSIPYRILHPLTTQQRCKKLSAKRRSHFHSSMPTWLHRLDERSRKMQTGSHPWSKVATTRSKWGKEDPQQIRINKTKSK